MDICCVQEVRFRGNQSRVFEGKATKYKFTWSGNDIGTYEVRVLVAEKWISSILEVNRILDRIIHLRLNLGKTLVSIVSVYAPQIGLSITDKDKFYGELLSL